MDMIEDETSCSYTIRTDKMSKGDSIQCRDDKDMCVEKNEDNSVLLIKKSFRNDCFSK